MLTNASGTHIAVLQVDRPDVMDAAYDDPANTKAVRTATGPSDGEESPAG